MNNRSLVRGIFLAAVALLFGLNSLRYNIGHFDRPGAGLFPLMVSALLGVIAVLTIVSSQLKHAEALEFNLKNISLLLSGLAGFTLASHYLDMAVGITMMVFIAGFAGSASYSIARNLKVSAGLIGVAFGFQKLLGLNLPLF